MMKKAYTPDEIVKHTPGGIKTMLHDDENAMFYIGSENNVDWITYVKDVTR